MDYPRANAQISINALPEIELTPVGWIMGHAIHAGEVVVVVGAGTDRRQQIPLLYFTPQSEPDDASKEWKVEARIIAQAPIGALASITCERAGKGFFNAGSAQHVGYAHIIGDRLVGACSNGFASASLGDSDRGILGRALAEMDAQSLEDLARAALGRAEALRARQKADDRAADALDAMRANTLSSVHS